MTSLVTRKSSEQIATMRRAGIVVAEMLARTRAAVRPGVTTGELDRIARQVLKERGAASSFLGYGDPPFPATICTSVNDEIVHGIPGRRKLREGDIVSIDAGAIVEGWHADAAITVPVGRASAPALELIRVTEEALYMAVEQLRPGKRLGDVGAAVQAHAESHGYAVVRSHVGHGIGTEMHQPPQVPNFGTPGTLREIHVGLVVAIEPMVNAGAAATRLLEDSWTVATTDGSLSAHFEHTVAVTEEGPVILTLPEAPAGAVAAPERAVGARR